MRRERVVRHTQSCSRQGFRDLAEEESCRLRRPLAQDRQAGRQWTERHLPRGGGDRALLGLDRRPEEGPRRPALSPALHAAARAQHLVEDQRRQGRGAHRGVPYAGAGLRADRDRQGRRTLGAGLRRSAHVPRCPRTCWRRWKASRRPTPSLQRSAANRYAVLWRIQTAVKAETRARRIAQLVEMLARGETIHIFKPSDLVPSSMPARDSGNGQRHDRSKRRDTQRQIRDRHPIVGAARASDSRRMLDPGTGNSRLLHRS